MTDSDQVFQTNKALWNELTAIHASGEVYRMTDFKAGVKQLDPIVRAEVGDVAGKSLLHLQCHFGMDSLMWARLGARVTGIDMSDAAIALARRLSDEIGVAATFVESNLYDLPRALDGEFDIVYTSWGALLWLADLSSWARIVARFLAPDGFFYIAEGHPFIQVFYEEDDATDLRVHYNYFHEDQPVYFPPGHDYADQTQQVASPGYLWRHSVGDILNALIGAGLKIAYFHEHEVIPWKAFPFMVKEENSNYWRLPPEYPPFPLSFSLMATKA
ncbi:MAG TPA: class I SAM-dependent methyltransferase [Ktedonobacterales bacterium]|nr:class I SAM-dependent methyltransferase [Ktedonobacterales bacterium]